jgi:hypothetical protein
MLSSCLDEVSYVIFIHNKILILTIFEVLNIQNYCFINIFSH